MAANGHQTDLLPEILHNVSLIGRRRQRPADLAEAGERKDCLRWRSVDRSRWFALGLLRARVPIDPVTPAPRVKKPSIVFLPVRLIAEHLSLLSVQQVRQLRTVRYARFGCSHGMDNAAPIRADVQLHP